VDQARLSANRGSTSLAERSRAKLAPDRRLKPGRLRAVAWPGSQQGCRHHQGSEMAALSKLLTAAATAIVIASPAAAQDVGSWDLAERSAYVLDAKGKLWSMRMNDRGSAMIMRNAKAVPRGTVLFMSQGKLYMARQGLWSRDGDFLPGGV
jgi:hypothetical protein